MPTDFALQVLKQKLRDVQDIIATEILSPSDRTRLKYQIYSLEYAIEILETYTY